MTTDRLLRILAGHILDEGSKCNTPNGPIVATTVLVGIAAALINTADDVQAERQALIDKVQS